MHTFILQDWTTIRANNAGSTVIQSEEGWLDLSLFQDVFFWVDVREITGTVTLFFDTSPTADESLFQPLVAGGQVLTASTTPTLVRAPMTSASVPIARYVRWRMSGTTNPWDATFRVVLAANSPGM